MELPSGETGGEGWCVSQGFGFVPAKFIKHPCGNSENMAEWPSESEDLG